MAAPKKTVGRMPKRSAIQPKASAPVPEPSQASEYASAGVERALSKSAAISLRATTTTSGAPYENVKMKSTMVAASHEAPVSTVCTAGATSRSSALDTVNCPGFLGGWLV